MEKKITKERFSVMNKTGKLQFTYADHSNLTYLLVSSDLSKPYL